jgi:outer membrane protein TolC
MKFIWIATFLLLGLSSAKAFAGNHLTFDAFIKAVRQENLALQLESAKTQAALANAEGLAIPPPMVGYMRMTDQSGSSAAGFEIDQTIPFPTQLVRNHAARKFEAQAQEEARLGLESEILGNARLLYFNAWSSQQRRNALKEKKGALEIHLRLARAVVRGDSLLRIHLLKTESDLDLLENEILAVDQEIVEKQAAVAELINVDASSFRPEFDELPLLTPPSEHAFIFSHQLESARLSVESFKAKEQEARASWFPDLNLRYKQIGQTRLMPEISELMVGISLPFLFPWEPSASEAKASALRLQSEVAFQTEKRKINTLGSTLSSRASALEKQINNINQRLLPRAELRMKLARGLAPRDMETLQDHLETMLAFPDLKLKSLELQTQYEATRAELQKYQRGQQ